MRKVIISMEVVYVLRLNSFNYRRAREMLKPFDIVLASKQKILPRTRDKKHTKYFVYSCDFLLPQIKCKFFALGHKIQNISNTGPPKIVRRVPTKNTTIGRNSKGNQLPYNLLHRVPLWDRRRIKSKRSAACLTRVHFGNFLNQFH